MTEYINVETREEFAELLQDMKTATIVVADTETNGLKYYRGDEIISISVYLPEVDKAYNIPFRHGEGEIEVSYTDATEGKSYHEMSWQGKAKHQLFLRHWWAKFKSTVSPTYFGNLPEKWMEELKQVWGRKGVTYIFHNAPFDLHMLRKDGFPTPDKTEDTMLALHLLHEDWRGIQVNAPYKIEGKWARGAEGRLLRKQQQGNRKLKFQAAYWGLPNATAGETALDEAREALEATLTGFIYSKNHIGDETLAGYVNPGTGKRKGSLLYADYFKRSFEEADAKWQDKQIEKIRAKVAIDSKANMWMLPSYDVALYAMLDTVLTWQLRELVLDKLDKWDNLSLYENLCDIQLNVAWVMECNGLYVDLDELERQVRLYTPRVTEIEYLANDIAEALHEAYPDVPYPVNLSSNKELPVFLSYAVQHEWDLNEVLPAWLNGEARATMNNRPHKVLKGQLEYTNKEALRPFEDHPIVRLVLEYRKLKKTVGTYLKRWKEARDPDGYIHPSLWMDGTVAGRMSSSGDMGNGQNIPERNGYTIKQALVAPKGQILWAIDYGQLELRIAAWIAETLLPEQGAYSIPSKAMTDLFNSGKDMHAYVRDMAGIREVMFGNKSGYDILLSIGVDPTTMSEEEQEEYVDRKICRQMAKTFSFGLLYSGTYRVLMKLLHIEKEPAIIFENQWRDLFPAFAKAQEYFTELALTMRSSPSGHINNAMYATQPLTGRHRKLHQYPTYLRYLDNATQTWKSFNPREASARKVWNNEVQGTGGWMSVDSALRFMKEHTWEGVYPYLQIHDANDGRAELTHLDRIALLMDYMVDYPVNPGLTVDLEAGWNWQPYSESNPAGMWEVSDVGLWVRSKGLEGYKKQKEPRIEGVR